MHVGEMSGPRFPQFSTLRNQDVALCSDQGMLNAFVLTSCYDCLNDWEMYFDWITWVSSSHGTILRFPNIPGLDEVYCTCT